MNNLEQDIIKSAESFIELYKSNGTFDYSTASLYTIDEMLNDLHLNKPTDIEIANACSIFGSYIFETLKRNYGGTYAMDEIEPSLLSDSSLNRVKLLVFSKVGSRIIVGDSHSIIDYLKDYVIALYSEPLNESLDYKLIK
ncbi:MAG: hypothetical protein RR646_02375 [Erysipelotrichaceae bacterium]